MCSRSLEVFFRSHGVENQLLEMGGNLREVDFGKDCYDLVILGHILHSEGETSSRTVLRKAYRALRSGGCALIADYIPNADRTGPPQPLIFTLTMLLNTTEGTTFTISETSRDAFGCRVQNDSYFGHSGSVASARRRKVTYPVENVPAARQQGAQIQRSGGANKSLLVF